MTSITSDVNALVDATNSHNEVVTLRDFTKEWRVNDKLHRIGGHAYLEWYDGGQSRMEEWRINGDLHRIGGPARRAWYDNGNQYWEEWRINNKRHRIDGPAYRVWNENGAQRSETWLLHGGLHRIGGPAYRVWNVDGIVQSEEYWVFGNKITYGHRVWATKMGINFDDMTPEELTLFKLTWGTNTVQY